MGDSGPNLAGLAKIFNNPITYNVLPYKNFHSRDGKVQYTGFFIPAHEFSLDLNYLDDRGVTNHKEFKKFYEKRRALYSGIDLLDYCAEHCFTPDEALLKQGENIFDSVLLSDRITQLRVHKMGITPTPMALIWDKSQGDNTKIVKAIPTSSSKILIVEPPLVGDDGSPFKNLYVAGIDSIDMGTADSASDTDVSDFCIVIKRRVYGMMEPKYVAIYKDRPRDIRVAYENAMKLLTWYNCQALLEYTKISIQMYFKERGKENLFMSRPEFAMQNVRNRRQKKLIGIQATEKVITHGLELINSFITDYGYDIDFDEMLEQLLNYSYQNKKKFDIVASLGMCEIADEELSGAIPRIINNINKEWEDFGYYIDEYGVKRKGVIPNNFNYGARWKF